MKIPHLVDVSLGVCGIPHEPPRAEERAEEGEADDVGAPPPLGGATVELGLIGVPLAVVGLLESALASARTGAAVLDSVEESI